jgi:hypothetical protein
MSEDKIEEEQKEYTHVLSGQPDTLSASSQFPLAVLLYISPGRFLAVNEIKILFAYIIATYDIKFEEGHSGLRGSRILGVRLPANGNVKFRKRQN